jgi:Ser/Thr protein kinase RdoA (MazF antagonist)
MTNRSTATPTAEQALFAAEAPKLASEDARAIAWEVYGLRAQAELLSSERDQNFHLRLDDGSAYVLKATHPAEDPAVTDFQTQAQLHLMRANSSLPVPHLLLTRDGRYAHSHEGPAGVRRAIRVITFLPGTPLYKTTRSAAQAASLGRALAGFDLALLGFEHPTANHPLLWDLQHAGQVGDLLPGMEDAGQRALAERTLARFMADVRPALPGLRRQVIHNDLNPYNVLVDAVQPDRISAILDFGDMVQAPLAQDLAVACSYLLQDSASPLELVALCVASYHRLNPLTKPEIALLPDLIAARLLLTVAITGWRAKQHPENRSYILRNNAPAWIGLARLAAMPQGLAQDILSRACDTTLENPA